MRKSARLRRVPESRCLRRRSAYERNARPAERHTASPNSHSTTIPVSSRNELTNVSVLLGAAISSAKTGAETVSPPRLKAISKAVCAAKLKVGSLSHNATMTLVSRSSFSTQLPQPSTDAFSAGPDPGIADAAVLREGTRGPNRPHAEALSVPLEQQTVAGTHAQQSPHFAGHRDLPLAGELRLFLHSSFLTLAKIPYSAI